MKKHILLFVSIAFYSVMTHAQTVVPNGGFENWENLGTATEEPIHWNSNKTGGGFANFGPQTCFRDTSSLNGGAYCVKVMSGTAFGNVVNGSCATGKVEAPTAVKAEGYIHTIAGDSSFSSAFTGRPDSIVFWYKFKKYGTDNPKLEVRLHVGNAYAPEVPINSNHPDSTVNIIGRALWAGAAVDQATWMRVSVPIVYVNSRTPQYILVTMTGSADQSAGSDSSTLWVDGLQAIYGPSGIIEAQAAGVKVYWNDKGSLTADLTNSDMEHATLQLVNINGQIVSHQPLRDRTINTITTDIAAGVYIYKISNGEKGTTGKVIKQ